MVPLLSLWLPILLAAIFVFAVSSVIHMALPYHKSDFRRVPSEQEVLDALAPMDIPPGDYIVPFAGDHAAMKDPVFIQKLERGPVAFMTVLPKGVPSMTKSLILWFFYCLVIGVFAGYISGRALGPGAAFPAVMRFAGCAAFLGYAAALWQGSIWYKRPWWTTAKATFDGLLYALVTGATFAWLWPGP